MKEIEMSGIVSKRIRLQSLEKSSAQKVRGKGPVKSLSKSPKRGSSLSLQNCKEGKLTKLGSKKKEVAPALLADNKISVSSKQVAGGVKGKNSKKAAVSKLIARNTRATAAKSKKASKNARDGKSSTSKVDRAAKRPQSKETGASTRSRSITRKQAVQQALAIFEQAVKAFNRRNFAEAKGIFEGLQQRYPNEVDIFARAQTYIQVCDLRLSKLTDVLSAPRSADELYDCGVVALNVGNFAQALTMFEKALSLRPDDSHTLYSLAATYAQAGSTEQALRYLNLAVQKQPRFRQRALNDNEFTILHGNKRFLELLGAASPFDLLEMRRAVD
jgi:tetratricopeptide (TPR) repeat protein